MWNPGMPCPFQDRGPGSFRVHPAMPRTGPEPKTNQRRNMKILLPVDGSKHSLNAVRYVAERLWPSLEDAEIILLHVHYRVPPRAASAVGRTVVEGYYQSEAEAAQKGARKLLDQHGIPYNALRQPGYPGKVIPEYAESMGADL